MNIRKIKNEDVDKIIEIIVDFKNFDNANKYKMALKEIVKEDNNIYVYEKDNEVVGYCNFHIVNFPLIAGKELYISELFVDKTKRGMGIGRELINFAEDYAKKNGVVRMMLNNVNIIESYKRDFYKKRGFTERVNISNFIKEL